MRTGTSVPKGKRRAASTEPERTDAAAEVKASLAPAPLTTSTPGAVTKPAKKGRDPLLAGICHDLRAPLAAVTMGANFVFQTTPDDETNARSRRVLAAILRSCRQMERLVRDFGDLSEIEGDAVELREAVQDAGEMIEIAAEAARPEANARKITLAVRRPGEPLPFHCDRDRMLRALAHVIENAVRFSPEGGEVSIEVVAEPTDGTSEVRFNVTDRGPGISDETLAHLYDRTWHAKRPDRTGAGLGLAIVRGVLRAHGGRVEVDTKPGGPTTLSLLVPKDLPRAEASDQQTH